MNSPKSKTNQIEFEPFIKLIQVMKQDPIINDKVIYLLNLGSYQRRLILSKWLERLRISHAPESLMSALSYLFDDHIAEDILLLIKNRNN